MRRILISGRSATAGIAATTTGIVLGLLPAAASAALPSSISATPTRPPGQVGTGLTTILHWLGYGVAVAAVAAVIIQGGRLAWTVRQGGVGVQEHGSSLGWTLIGLMLVGGAGAVVGALT